MRVAEGNGRVQRVGLRCDRYRILLEVNCWFGN